MTADHEHQLDLAIERCAGELGDASRGDPPKAFLTPPTGAAANLADSLADLEDESMVGRRVGAFRITSLIAAGGMGAVYRAHRDDAAFEQEVAVKVLRSGFVSAQLQRRFRLERRLLARLEHPGITRLLDGGANEDGMLYLVMEYVDGAPIVAYCDHSKCNVEQRLRLFCRVCESVQYAHQHLIVHRDIKPSNVLVTAGGSPKLLDFGIARLLDDERGAAKDATATWHRAMTPQYASPEQIRGEPITTATDVYSLGVLLYELLTGVRPFDHATLTPYELQQAVCEEEPAPPSTAIGRSSPPGQTRRVVRSLRGDLDRIVLKAMQKDPSRRYASAAELAEDIQRHLDGHPVRAQADTFAYRARKFIRRHKAGLAASIAIILLLAAGIVGTSIGLARESEAKRDAIAAANRAEQAKIEALRINVFLRSVLASANPTIGRGPDASLRDMLAEASSRIETELSDYPLAQAALFETLGETYFALGSLETAEAHLRRALALHRKAGSDDITIAQAHAAIGGVLAGRCRLIDAAHHFNAAWRILDREPERFEARASILIELGGVLLRNGELERGLQYFQRAHRIAARELDSDHAMLGRSLAGRGVSQLLLGHYDEAEVLYQQALVVFAHTMPDDEPVVFMTRAGLAKLRHEQGRLTESAAIYEHLLEKVIPTEYFGSMQVRKNYGDLLADLGRTEEARAQFSLVHETWLSVLGPDDCRTRAAAQALEDLHAPQSGVGDGIR